METTVSVVIPVYNCQAYLAESVTSVCDQSTPLTEILIVDDGSTDNTPAVAKRLIATHSDRQIHYLAQSHSGPGAARNTGIAHARGEYIAFLDSDDVLLEGSLSTRSKILTNHPDVALVFSDYHIRYNPKRAEYRRLRSNGIDGYLEENGMKKVDDHYFLDRSFIDIYLSFSPYPIFTSTVMIRSNVIRPGSLFRTDILTAEDLDFFLKLLKRDNCAYIPDSLAWYNYHRGSLARQTEQIANDTLMVLNSHLVNCKRAKFRDACCQQIKKISTKLN